MLGALDAIGAAMQYSETIYYATDFEAAVAFHRDVLGLEVKERADWGWALLTSEDGARVGILKECFAKGEAAFPRPRLAFKTHDLEAEVRRLVEHGIRCDPIQGEKGATRAVNFYDADSNSYFLWEEGSPVKR
jgi:catechol 2,3-dioxygenase-like lactoylglutathione lyase family enzyme